MSENDLLLKTLRECKWLMDRNNLLHEELETAKDEIYGLKNRYKTLENDLRLCIEEKFKAQAYAKEGWDNFRKALEVAAKIQYPGLTNIVKTNESQMLRQGKTDQYQNDGSETLKINFTDGPHRLNKSG